MVSFMSVHPGVIARQSAAPRGWFALAIPATVAYLVVASLVWSVCGLASLAVLAGALPAAATALLARRQRADCLVAYLVGTGTTLLGLYAALAVMAEFWMHGVGG
jgi:hypothetical protein